MLLKEAKEHGDTKLVEDTLRGDPDAFDELVRRYKDRVYCVIYRFVGNHEDAMDLAQEVFVRAYRGLHAYRGHSQIYTWLYSIAANLGRNSLRDRSRKGRNLGMSLDALEAETPSVTAETAQAANPRETASKRELEAALGVSSSFLARDGRRDTARQVGRNITGTVELILSGKARQHVVFRQRQRPA